MSCLTNHDVLVFDVYATLIDWETGIFDALQPLLALVPPSKRWSRKAALVAYSTTEQDLQSKYPNALYSDLLFRIHAKLEEALLVETGTITPDLAPNIVANHENLHRAFAKSIRYWPLFPDTAEALLRLSSHFKLVVLSNVDHVSFEYTHEALSTGVFLHASQTDAPPNPFYTRPVGPIWLPRSIEDCQSPFSMIITAQDTHAYKPSPEMFHYALRAIREQGLLKNPNPSPTEVIQKTLIVAQSLTHDIVPGASLGMSTTWIDRGKTKESGGVKWNWRFESLGEIADAVVRERRRLE